MGTVYLLHFHLPFKHAKHYIGFVKGELQDVDTRLALHRSGDGARLLRAVTAAGIGFDLVRTWEDKTRSFERWLKNWKGATKLCPICCPKMKNRGNKGPLNLTCKKV